MQTIPVEVLTLPNPNMTVDGDDGWPNRKRLNNSHA